MLLASMMVVATPTPASASTLSWGSESSVNDLKDAVDNILIDEDYDGLDIVSMAVNGNTIYAVTGTSTSDNLTYKSTDGGASWSSLITSTDYPTDYAPMLVAVAPDDADIVAIVTAEPEVWLSTNGGAEWDDLDIPSGATVNAVDISGGATNYIAIGGTDGTDAELYTMKLAMAESWEAESGEGDTANFTAHTDVWAVKFSPNFETDEVIAVITGNDSGTDHPYFQLFRWTEDQQSWNADVAYDGMEDEEDWDGGLELDLEDISGGVAAADISIPEAFLATDPLERTLVVGTAGGTGGGGVARVTDTDVEQFDNWAGNDVGDNGFGSVAYNESTGGLIAGEYLDNKVERWSKITGSSPDAERPNTIKQPGGADTTLVAWSDDIAVAATSGDESAFAVSTDDGYAWNDVSLIDTLIEGIHDVAVSADGSVIYMTTYSGNDASVWAKASSWMRVFSKPNLDANTAGFLVRVAPEDSSAVYVSANNSQKMWVSKNMGKESWKSIPNYKLTKVQDFVVESADVVHAIDAVSATMTTNSGASWRTEVSLDGVAGYMITLAPNNDILVGGSDGYVSFSKDGGSTFTKISDKTTTGNCHVVADKDYADNNIIYVASGDTVEVGEADKNESWSSSASPDSIEDDSAGDVTGAVRVDDVIYVLTSNGTDSRLYRALNLRDADTAALALWSYRQKDGYDLGATPQALKVSPDYKSGPRFWALDVDSTMTMRRITDPIALAGPTVTGPDNGEVIPVNVESGQSYDVTFSWERYSSKYIVSMDIEIATDSNFNAKIIDETIYDIDTDGVAEVFGPGRSGIYSASFMPGMTYYWRVRHSKEVSSAQGNDDRNFNSPWSETRSFKIQSPEMFTIITPTVGATGVSISPTFSWAPYEGAIGYEVAVAEDNTFAILDYSHSTEATFYKAEETLKYNTTYYWRVRGVTGPAPAKKAAPGGPWITGVFTTEAKAAEPTPPVVIEPTPPTPAPEIKVIEVPAPAAIPPTLLYVIVAIGAVLVIALIVLIVRTRRVA
jgi:hypothetical protein